MARGGVCRLLFRRLAAPIVTGGGLDLGVAGELLDGAEIGAGIEQVADEGAWDSGSPLAPYADYLSQLWDQGCHKGLQLWRAVSDQEYSGPRSAICAADRTEAEHRVLEHLLELCPDARVAFGLTERFLHLVRERQANLLDAWLKDAAATGLPEFRSFATGLQRDKAAIVAAVSLPHSNGQTEGQIPKLKLLKRSMYGRASFELLRRRVLLAR